VDLAPRLSGAARLERSPLPIVTGDCVMDLIWIIVIVLVVLALLGYFGRGRFRR
jgi:hypothetical protein